MLPSEQLGIDNSKKVMGLVVSAILLGAEIAKDGLTFEDIKHTPKVLDLTKTVYDFIKSKPELVKEFRDYDSSEVVTLLIAGIQAFKDAKAALEEVNQVAE